MAALFDRTALTRGPAIVGWNGATLFTRDDIVPRLNPEWKGVEASMYGRVDKYVSDRMYKVSLPLWGSFDYISKLFPSAVLNPTIGASVFGSSDLPLTLTARNGDKLTFTNAALTKLANLQLGVDAELFSASAEFTCILGKGNNPEDTAAYYTVQTGQTFTESAFAKTNFSRARWSGAWGTITGFTAFAAQKGFMVEWEFETNSAAGRVDGYGTMDVVITGLRGRAKCVPIGPSIAQLEAQQQAGGDVLGSLLSGVSADLTLTGGSHSVVLKSAGIVEHGYAFGVVPLRLGEVVWETTRGFSAGVPQGLATVL
jgi:hypothetical protein